MVRGIIATYVAEGSTLWYLHLYLCWYKNVLREQTNKQTEVHIEPYKYRNVDKHSAVAVGEDAF